MSGTGYVIQINAERLEKPEKPTAILACFRKRLSCFSPSCKIYKQARNSLIIFCAGVSKVGLELGISIGDSMICSDIWHKYHEWYLKIVIRNFTSR